MISEPTNSPSADDGFVSEALSNEVLKLKVDDLYQEIEVLKRRLERLEGIPDRASTDAPAAAQRSAGTVSDPDNR